MRREKEQLLTFEEDVDQFSGLLLRDHRRTVGSYLCDRPIVEPLIDIDQLPWDDAHQDAALRAIVALRRAGKPVGPDPVAAFDAEPRLVMTAYNRARIDALRQLLGRNHDPQAARWRRLLSQDDAFAEIADPLQGAALDELVDRIAASTRLALLHHQSCGGIPKYRMRKILTLLRRVQRLKRDGLTVVPPDLRQALSRLRRQSDLPLDTRLL